MHPLISSSSPAPGTRSRYAVAALAAALILLQSGPALASGGALDTTFGAGGISLTNTTGDTPSQNDSDTAEAIAVQPDGKIVAVGGQIVLNSGTGQDFKIMRYEANGTLDSTFGNGGVVTAFASAATDSVKDVAVQPDGKIIAVGFTFSTSPNSALVVRVNADGSPDTTFGVGGSVKLYYAAGVGASADGVVLQSDGKIVIAGESYPQWGVARLLPENGALDPSFGTGGKTVVTPSSQMVVRTGDVALQVVSGEERIVLAGGFQKGNGTDFGIMRLRPNGAKDLTFGTSGSVQTDWNGGGDKIMDVCVDSSNRLVVAGTAGPGKGMRTDNDFGVARYTTGGALDATFGTGGKVRTDFSGLADSPWSLTLQSDGKIVVAGYANGISSGPDMALARYTTGGQLDASFGSGGRVQIDLSTRSDYVRSIVTQTVANADGTTRERLVVCGTSDTGTGYSTLLAAFEE